MFDSLYYQIHDGHEQVFFFMENSQYRDQLYRTDIVGIKFSEIQTRKMAILFALGNYILKKGKNEYLDSIMNLLPNNIDYITYIYQLSNSFALENEFGWSWWGSEEYDELEVHTIDNDTSDFFIYFILKTINNFANTKSEYQFDESLIFKIKDSDGKVIKKIEQLDLDKFNTEEIEKIDSLKEYFKAISETYEIRKMELISSSSLDSNKINDVKENIIKGYNNHFGLSDLFRANNSIKYLSEIDGNAINGGYNQLLNKEPFLVDGTGIVGIGQYGIGVKDFETQRIFLYWYNNCEISNISNFEFKDSYNKQSHPIIISTFTKISEVRKQCSDHFKESWQINSGHLDSKSIGFYEHKNLSIPIIDLGFRTDSEFTEKLFLIDPSIIGNIEYKKIDDSSLKFEFIDLNNDEVLVSKILDDDPMYLKDIENKDLYLRSKLVFKLLIKFKIIKNKMKLYEI